MISQTPTDIKYRY